MFVDPRSGRILSLLVLGGILIQCGCAPDPVITTHDGSEMLFIAKGEFLMGGQPEDMKEHPEMTNYLNFLGERPVHTVKLSAFYLDKLEVTNAQYRRFLEYIKSTGDKSMYHPDQPQDAEPGQYLADENLLGENQPVVGLSWFDAYAYCKWAGKRLPTEAEWEYAARGKGKVYRKYPWGNENPEADGIWRANYQSAPRPEADGYPLSAPVGSFPDGISPFGILDMAGNAEEWVNDWLDFGYYGQTEGARDPKGPETGTDKVIKGGSYGSADYLIRTAVRLYGPPDARSRFLGVRCARDI
jgi:formylglycine-generating enzyme required for sulfatase activity